MKDRKFIDGHIRAISEDVEETRTIEFIISTEKKDRHGTRLMLDRWDLDNFNKNGIIGYQHNVYGNMCDAPNPDDVIGAGKAWIDGDELIGSVKFEPKEINPLAEKIFRKVLHGSLKSTSVGFTETKTGEFGEGLEAKGAENQTYIYGAQELLEFSIVNIPSNTDAIKRTLKDQTAHALMFIKKFTNKSFADIEDMTVRDVISELSGEVKEVKEEDKFISKEKAELIDKDIRIKENACNSQVV